MISFQLALKKFATNSNSSPLGPVYTVVRAAGSSSRVNPTTIGTISRAAIIRSPWKKSVQQTALNPPRKVYTTTIAAKIIIAVLLGSSGTSVVNTSEPATKADAT